MKNNSLYCCYSIPLKEFLLKSGMRYELVALNPNTNNPFWVFMKNDNLNTLLNEWKKIIN